VRKKLKWTADKIVWPWSIEKFPGSKRDLEYIADRLAERGFRIKKLNSEPPDAQKIAAAEELLVKMLNVRDSGDVPWVLAYGDSVRVLQALAEITPIGYTLTTMASCNVITSARLVGLFFQRHPIDLWDDDPAGESVEELKKSGFLSWMDVTSPVGGSASQRGRFSEILSYRIKYRLPTLFTALVMDPLDALKSRKRLIEDIEAALGTAAAVMINQDAEKMVLKSSGQPREVSGLGV